MSSEGRTETIDTKFVFVTNGVATLFFGAKDIDGTAVFMLRFWQIARRKEACRMALYHKALNTPQPDPEELRKRMRYLEKEQAKLEKRLADAPEGSLVVSRKSNTSSPGFYHSLERSKRSYLNQTQRETICRLAQKEYDQKALRTIRKELLGLKRILDYSMSPKLEDVITLCQPEKQKYITPTVPSDKEYLEAWLSQEYVKKDPDDGMHIFPTERGDMVCSKSEGAQADYMFHHDFYYLYEKELELVDHGRTVWRFPDFTILDPVTREEVIFEHFGMVDDPDYVQAMFDKIRLYQQNGYVIGQNFLFTFESRAHPFTMDQFIAVLKARFGR